MLQRELKEKEQENRISKLKIKEMKRLIKHNQLKPIKKKDGENSVVSDQQRHTDAKDPKSNTAFRVDSRTGVMDGQNDGK